MQERKQPLDGIETHRFIFVVAALLRVLHVILLIASALIVGITASRLIILIIASRLIILIICHIQIYLYRYAT